LSAKQKAAQDGRVRVRMQPSRRNLAIWWSACNAAEALSPGGAPPKPLVERKGACPPAPKSVATGMSGIGVEPDPASCKRTSEDGRSCRVNAGWRRAQAGLLAGGNGAEPKAAAKVFRASP